MKLWGYFGDSEQITLVMGDRRGEIGLLYTRLKYRYVGICNGCGFKFIASYFYLFEISSRLFELLCKRVADSFILALN